jgi:hypothetical protein
VRSGLGNEQTCERPEQPQIALGHLAGSAWTHERASPSKDYDSQTLILQRKVLFTIVPPRFLLSSFTCLYTQGFQKLTSRLGNQQPAPF